MFAVNEDKSIYITRGDAAVIVVDAIEDEDGHPAYIFKAGDTIRFRVFEKGNFGRIFLTKLVDVTEETTVVNIQLSSYDTKIGELIHKPKDYWYEIELNPETNPQTIVGYDTEGPKVFRLFPEGADE